MDIGLVGLGKMGGNMRERLRRAGTPSSATTATPTSPTSDPRGAGREAAQPKVVWVMVPAGDPTRRRSVSSGAARRGRRRRRRRQLPLDRRPGQRRLLAEKGIGFVDCGVSGGVWGLENGYALMYGGDAEDVAKVQPAFDALKPEGEFGFVHAGKVGAGHFAKMVHNGIEYAMMQAYAEGWELLEKVDLVDNVPEVFARGARAP
jgi:6-phosphogluconate dehydrogenase